MRFLKHFYYNNHSMSQIAEDLNDTKADNVKHQKARCQIKKTEFKTNKTNQTKEDFYLKIENKTSINLDVLHEANFGISNKSKNVTLIINSLNNKNISFILNELKSSSNDKKVLLKIDSLNQIINLYRNSYTFESNFVIYLLMKNLIIDSSELFYLKVMN